MAAEGEQHCIICYGDQENIACLSPCLHRLCLGCALRWARQNPTCPLCRAATTAISLPAPLGDEQLTFDVPDPVEPAVGDSGDQAVEPMEVVEEAMEEASLLLAVEDPAEPAAEGSPAEQEEAAGLGPGDQLGGFPPEVWADFFNTGPSNIGPLLPWLRRELGSLYGHRWWEAAKAQSNIVGLLCSWGPAEEPLVGRLQSSLGDDTRPFVRRLIAATVDLCHEQLLGLVGQREPLVAWWEDNSPAASPSPGPGASGRSSPGGPDEQGEADRPEEAAGGSEEAAGGPEEAAGASQRALRGAPARPRPATDPVERARPREEPGRAAAAGPSARGRGRSAAGRGRGRSTGRPRRPAKRRAPGPQDSPRPRKTPRRREDSRGDNE